MSRDGSIIQKISIGLNKIIDIGKISTFEILFKYMNESIRANRNLSPNTLPTIRSQFLRRIKSIFENNISRYPRSKKEKENQRIISYIDHALTNLLRSKSEPLPSLTSLSGERISQNTVLRSKKSTTILFGILIWRI